MENAELQLRRARWHKGKTNLRPRQEFKCQQVLSAETYSLRITLYSFYASFFLCWFLNSIQQGLRLSTIQGPVIGPLHDPVTWHKITHQAGEQVAWWDFQNNATLTSPSGPGFVLEAPVTAQLVHQHVWFTTMSLDRAKGSGYSYF